MDERQEGKSLTIDKDAQINVVVNRPDSDETTIDLGRVFHNMKLKKRVFAWVLVLCLVVGLCAPLLMYQLSKPMLTVSSVVTLRYNVRTARTVNGETVYSYRPVTDLTAPDGTELDLSMITSSYVLQNALKDLNLSQPLSLGSLRSNIAVERVLTEDSRRAQELASKMSEDKDNGAYEQMQAVQMSYEPKFLVTLTNGFTDSNAEYSPKKELQDSELPLLLNKILAAYNDYLVLTYADLKLPDDEISVIDTETLDILESLDLLRTATENLYTYCENQPESGRTYRSWQTGLSLEDWMEKLTVDRQTSIDYLYAYVYNNSIVKDRQAMITNYEFQLRNAQTKLDTVNGNIATIQDILEKYKNDEIFVSMQESDSSKSTSTTTDYYNQLILQQAAAYNDAAKLEITIADLQDKLSALQDETKATEIADLTEAEVTTELQKVFELCKENYNGIKAHMLELQSSSFYTDYADSTAAQGRLPSFLSASLKKMIIGAVAGLVIACGLWFLAGLLPEFHREEKETNATKANKTEKEAAEA